MACTSETPAARGHSSRRAGARIRASAMRTGGSASPSGWGSRTTRATAYGSSTCATACTGRGTCASWIPARLAGRVEPGRGDRMMHLPWRPTIGGRPPLPPGVGLHPPADPLPFPLAQPNHRLYAFARQAIWDAVRAVGLAEGDEVLVPVHHHGAEVEALIRAGLRPRFFHGGPDLAPEADELERLAGSRTRLLCLIHHLGFPQDGRRWRRWCDERGILLLEDAAHAWLATVGGEPVGSWGHLAVFCLHNTFGVPEGAAVISEAPVTEPSDEQAQGLRQVVAGHIKRVPGRAIRAAIARSSYDEAAAGRRANYRLLLDELGERVAHPFATLPEGASPFV